MALFYSLSSSFFKLTYFIKLNNIPPSLQRHYSAFFTTTGYSAPVPCIGTQILMGSPFGLLPLHHDDRFPSSIQKPASGSCHLHAGCRISSKQVSLMLIPGQRLLPGFDIFPTLSTLLQWFNCVHLPDTHLISLLRPFL